MPCMGIQIRIMVFHQIEVKICYTISTRTESQGISIDSVLRKCHVMETKIVCVCTLNQFKHVVFIT